MSILYSILIFWATVYNTVRSMLSDRCLSCLSCLFVTFVYYGQRFEPRPRPHCVRWGPSSPHGGSWVVSFMRFPAYFYFRFWPRRWLIASFIAIFAISCTRYSVCRPLCSRLTLNDARRRYSRFCRNQKLY